MPDFALHVDSCKKVFDKFKLRKESFKFALVSVGSLVTDLDNFGILQRCHGRAEEFLQHLLKTDPKYAPLAVGMILHEELDKVIDEEFVNPHIPVAEELLDQYKISCEKVSHAAHNLIDHAVNCDLLEKEPSILRLTDLIKRKLSHKHLHRIAYHLTTFFGGDKDRVLKAIHMFREFDLYRYLSPDDASTLYSKFYLLQQELQGKTKVKLRDKIKLGFKYGKFLLTHHKEDVKAVCVKARHKFKNHRKASKNAQKAIMKRLAKISSTYAFSLK